MAAIQASSLWNEVNAVLGSEAKPVIFTLEVTIHANGKDINPIYVLENNLHRNYIQNHTDVNSISVVVPLGVFNYDLLPYKNNFEVTVRRIPYLENQKPSRDLSQAIESYRYRGHLYDNTSDTKEGNNPAVFDKDIADRTDIKQIRIMLTSLAYEQLRTKTFGTVIRDAKPIDAIRAVLGSQSVTPSKDNTTVVKGVTIAPNYDETIYDHIPIRHLTPVLKVPDLVDRVTGGVYPTGLAFYLQNGYWFVYSPYDVKAFDKSKKTLTVVNVPANRVVSPERSYRETPTQVILLATGEVKHVDLSEQMQLNYGNGTRFVDASVVMEDFATTGNNKLTVEAKGNVNEIVNQKRDDGVDYVLESEDRITSNYHNEFAKLAARNGAFIQLVWENSNDSILYPGMPTRYMYLEDQQAKEVYGILVGVESSLMSGTRSVTNRRFSANTTLTIFINAKDS